MDLVNMLMDAQGGKSLDALAQQFGLDKGQALGALGALVPAVTGGMQRNAKQGGLNSLLSALAQGDHDKYLDDPAQVATPQAAQVGNKILGHALGSKDVSRAVAQRASAQTGLDNDVLKKMLPVVATMVMGALSKKAGGGTAYTGSGASSGGGGLGDVVSGVLGSVLGGNNKGARSAGNSAADLLTSALDQDGDGSMIDDVLGSLFKR